VSAVGTGFVIGASARPIMHHVKQYLSAVGPVSLSEFIVEQQTNYD